MYDLSAFTVLVLTGLGELEAVGDVDDLLVLVEFKRRSADVVISFHLIAERRMSLVRIHVEQSTCTFRSYLAQLLSR